MADEPTIDSLVGKTIVFSGTLSMKRSEAVKLAKDADATVTTAVSGKTNVLVAGAGAGAKATEAEAKGITVITEAAFLKCFGGAAPPSGEPAGAKKRSADAPDQKLPEKVARKEEAPKPPAGADVVAVDLADSKTAIKNKMKGKTGIHVQLTNTKKKTAVMAEFLMDMKRIHSMDLTALAGGVVTTIGDRFLWGCEELKSIDLSPLSGVQEIGAHFLSYCSGLRSVVLPRPAGSKAVGNGFLWGCKGLETVDLSPLAGRDEVGNSFLEGCSSLESIDLNPLTGVKAIGVFFLSGCRTLKSIDLSPLSGVQQIGTGFLDSCPELKNVDLAPVRQAGVTSI